MDSFLQKYSASPTKVILGSILSLLAALTWWQFVATVFWPAATVDEWRRPAAWVAARLAVEGRGHELYTQAFHDASLQLGAIPDIFEPSAPTSLLPYLPLATLDVNKARTLWIFFSLACFVVAWIALLRALRLPLLMALTLWAIAPLFQPWSYSIYVGQAYPSALLFTVAGALLATRVEQAGEAMTHRQRWRASLASGCAFAFVAIIRHFYGAVQIVPALVRRQWTVVGAAIGVFGVGALLTLAVVGAETWGTSLHLALTWRERPETAVTAYQSVNNILTHLFRYHPTWNPGPIVDAPELVGPLWWGVTLTIFSVSAFAIWRSRDLSREATLAQKLLPYTLATPLALLVSPISEEYHYMLTLFPLVVVAGVLFQMRKPPSALQTNRRQQLVGIVAGWIVLVTSAVLLGAPFRFYNVPVEPGWAALLYYPRLYGNLMLWGLVVMLLWRTPKGPSSIPPQRAWVVRPAPPLEQPSTPQGS